MADEMEIIIKAVDEASDEFKEIAESVSDMGSEISDSVAGASSSFEDLSYSAEELEDDFAGVSQNTQELNDLLDEIYPDSLDDLASGAESAEDGLSGVASSAGEANDQLQETANNIDAIMTAGFQMEVFNTISESLSACADAAGTYSDRLTRLNLEMEGVGVSAEAASSLVSELGAATGRSAASISESLISMSSVGITSTESMKSVFEGASAQAFLLGVSVESLASKYSGLAMKSSIAERTLRGTGISVQELGAALGMQGATIDEINAKWETMTIDARAAALGQAAAMNEGKNANEAYKNSWEGLHAQLDMAWGKLQRLVGEVLLPTLIPAIQVATSVLQGLGGVISWVMSSPLGGLISVLGSAAAGVIILTTGMSLLTTLTKALGLASTFTAIEAAALAIAEDGLSVSSVLAAVGSSGLTAGLIGTAGAAWNAALAVWALISPLLPFIAIGAAVALVIYEIGKAFGWWKDVGTMLEAISAGIQRLWSAFINHPDVQAALQAISSALQWVWNGLVQAGQAVLQFFGISTSGGFDIVRALIDGIGAAWNAITFPIRLVISAVQWLVGAFTNASNAVGGFGNVLLIALGPIGWIIIGIQRLIGFLTGGEGKI